MGRRQDEVVFVFGRWGESEKVFNWSLLHILHFVELPVQVFLPLFIFTNAGMFLLDVYFSSLF